MSTLSGSEDVSGADSLHPGEAKDEFISRVEVDNPGFTTAVNRLLSSKERSRDTMLMLGDRNSEDEASGEYDYWGHDRCGRK